MKKQYINHNELAEAFGVTRATVTEWKKEGCPLLNLKPGAKRDFCRFNVAEVAAWLQSRAAGKEVQA